MLFEQTVHKHYLILEGTETHNISRKLLYSQNKTRPISAYSNTTHNFLGKDHMQSIFGNIIRNA